jgi:hypothetical protein
MHSLPAVLLGLAALLALAACGTADEKKPPTAATIAALYGMQAVSDALYDAALGAADSPPSLPYSAAAQATAGESEAAAFAQSMIGSLGGLSQPLALLTGNYPCRGNGGPPGSVDLNGDVTLSDSGGSPRTITLQITGLTATANACAGHGYIVSGSRTLNVDDKLVQTVDDPPNVYHWTLTRNESASGSGTITKLATGASYGVSFAWSRNGTIGADVDTLPDPDELIPGSASINQTVNLSVNGQTCTGTITSFNLFVGYSWTCSGP